jgi:hypothetical protein
MLSHGSVMSAERISIASAFAITFQIYLGAKDADGADGAEPGALERRLQR